MKTNKLTNENNNIIKEDMYYIYNFFQANYLINNGIPVIGVGKGKLGDPYINFPINKHSQEVNMQWKEICNMTKANNK